MINFILDVIKFFEPQAWDEVGWLKLIFGFLFK